jgi:hypothetical protein
MARSLAVFEVIRQALFIREVRAIINIGDEEYLASVDQQLSRFKLVYFILLQTNLESFDAFYGYWMSFAERLVRIHREIIDSFRPGTPFYGSDSTWCHVRYYEIGLHIVWKYLVGKV